MHTLYRNNNTIWALLGSNNAYYLSWATWNMYCIINIHILRRMYLHVCIAVCVMCVRRFGVRTYKVERVIQKQPCSFFQLTSWKKKTRKLSGQPNQTRDRTRLNSYRTEYHLAENLSHFLKRNVSICEHEFG